jgi:hypothetical protein
MIAQHAHKVKRELMLLLSAEFVRGMNMAISLDCPAAIVAKPACFAQETIQENRLQPLVTSGLRIGLDSSTFTNAILPNFASAETCA